ncbi:MAG TPA: vitamin B12-dependent ribonucleotide reductase [Dictyoglomaceae bacterium]|nr:vitamin B12-dependent ribonucleotide reductase [Dictyoglomaceae bacterium]HOL39614.1 vitamin B12-dependent ribonucleotide reductase [Dictyoglomaceae bacterium]HOP95164.1 vitamin B12-dependent ribonucleotide reductase [Dictyoglomaceae bacterium]HPP15186.1 vitamin B12-dependent ribonucleotide reductase [Dictyoglomaceae bacterium]HPU42592.1 vitamin B12-dependent ribonucleotide reductase [Dictyoglomaceae bacterium]
MNRVEFTEQALTILEKRYLKKDENGNVIETPEKMFERVAETIAMADLIYNPNADVEKIKEMFYDMMISLEFLPNSPTLMNAGRPLGQLSACFVIPIEDSLVSIFEGLKYAALIHQSGGGTGFSFSKLRPKGDIVRTTGGIASGPVSFLKVYDAATDTIKQGGVRRGANMGILRVDHPDVFEFITCKNQEGVLTNFNISVAITDKFMEAVLKDEEFELINPRNKEAVEKVSAKEIFNLIVEQAWKNGEPGIIFIDEINRKNPTPEVGEIESTNPCGEQPLLSFESCNLGSINLGKMVKNINGTYMIDWEKLKETTYKAVHFLDNVIDVNYYPLKEIETMTKANRKIGLGVMGFYDLLILLGLPYNTEEAREVAQEIMKFIWEEARKASVQLAEERGVFPNWEKSIYKDMDLKLRNATLTTIAPTGSISIIANCSSGIEPVFALAYKRKISLGEWNEIYPLFKEILVNEGIYSDELIEKVIEKGSIQEIEEIPEKIRKLFVTALDISPEDHILMQATFQKYVDNAVSKTVNLRQSATKEDIRKIYLMAYQLGLKGITVYRDKSRSVQVLGIEGEEREEEKHGVKPRPRPVITKGATIKVKTGCGNLYVTINEDKFGICEVFSTLGKAGGCAASQTEAISRLISLALRSGVDINSVIKQLKGIRCPNPTRGEEGDFIFSCSDAIAKALEKYLRVKKGEIDSSNFFVDANPKEKESTYSGVLCPECGSPLQMAEGCLTCRVCGYSKCY